MTKGHYRRYYNALQFSARQENGIRRVAARCLAAGAPGGRRSLRESCPGGPSGRPAVPRVTSPGGGCAGPVWGYGGGATGLGPRVWSYGFGATGALSGTGAEAAGVHERAEAPLPHPDGAAGQGAPTARRRRAESRIAAHRDGSRLGTVPIPGGGVPVSGRACAPPALRRSPRCAGWGRPPPGEVGRGRRFGRSCLWGYALRRESSRRSGSAPPRPCGPLCRPPPGELAGGRRSLAGASLCLVAWAPGASSASAWRLVRIAERSRG